MSYPSFFFFFCLFVCLLFVLCCFVGHGNHILINHLDFLSDVG